MAFQDDPGCSTLLEAVNDGNVKMKQVQKAGLARSFFAEILSSLGKTPCDYLKTKRSTCTLIAKNMQDDEDGKVWDWYVLNCPQGPPCEFLQNL